VNRPVIPTLRTRPLLAAAGVLALVALGACSTQSPLQTTVPYQPADGVAASNGAVQARDLLVVSSRKDGPGLLSGSVINTGSEPVTVSFLTRADSEAGTGKGTSVQLKGREQKRLEAVQLDKVPDAPGALTAIIISTGAGQSLVNVPVLLPQGPYATLTPTTVATTAATLTPTTVATTAPATSAPATTATATG